MADAWQGYIDHICGDGSVVEKAAIMMKDGSFVHSSADFSGFANNLEFPGSVRYGGRKYMVLRTVPLSDDVNTLIGSATSEPKNGLVMATTKTMVLLGNSPAGSGATGSANAQKVVGQMAEYLASQGM